MYLRWWLHKWKTYTEHSYFFLLTKLKSRKYLEAIFMPTVNWCCMYDIRSVCTICSTTYQCQVVLHEPGSPSSPPLSYQILSGPGGIIVPGLQQSLNTISSGILLYCILRYCSSPWLFQNLNLKNSWLWGYEHFPSNFTDFSQLHSTLPGEKIRR